MSRYVVGPAERDRRELKEFTDEINPPDFDPIENADQVRQRGELTRLCTDLANSRRRRSSWPATTASCGRATSNRRGRPWPD